MPPVDITLLRNVVDPFLAGAPELHAELVPIIEAADSDNLPNAEDNELTLSESRTFLRRSLREARNAHSILTANREDLVGSLREARDLVEEAGGSEELTNLLEMAAEHDDEDNQLNEGEIDLLFQQIEQTLLQLGDIPEEYEAAIAAGEMEAPEVLTAENFLANAQRLVTEARAVRREIPTAFIPEEETERRATIDLNFLRTLPPTTLFAETEQGAIIQQLLLSGQILDLEVLESNPDALREDNPDFEVLLNRDQEWDLTYDDLIRAYANLPDEQRAEMPPAEEMMCNLRFLATSLREEFNSRLADAVRAGEGDADGIVLSELISRRAEFGHNSFINQLIDAAGPDGVLTRPDVVEHLRGVASRNPGIDIDPEVYFASARQMVEDLVGASPEEAAAIAESGEFSPDEFLNQMVLDDLRRMRDGFSLTDMDYVENDSLFAFANAGMHFFTAVGTLGIYHLAGGPSWRDVRREQAEAGTVECSNAIQFLERMLERPDADFRAWLESRPEGERSVNVPNALEYMRNYGERFQERINALLGHEISAEDLRRYVADLESGDAERIAAIPEAHRGYVDFRSMYEEDPIGEFHARNYLYMYNAETPRIMARHHELLTSSVLQAGRLWEIRSIRDRAQSETAWFNFAEELRNGVWTSGSTVLAHTGNYTFAREILHALRRLSTDPEMRSQARITYQDSIGADITDDAGAVVERGNGEFGLMPVDWFRNFSDENANYAINDIILLVATWRAGGILFRGGTRLISTGGRMLGRGIVRGLGFSVLTTGGSSALAGAAAEVGLVEGPGMVARWIARQIARRVTAAEGRLIALRAARAGGQTVTNAEIRAAEETLANASQVHGILTSPVAASLPRRLATATAERVLRPDALVGRIVTRVGAWSTRTAAWINATAETRLGSAAFNTLAVTLWLMGKGLRTTGRLLRYASYDGIVTWGIAGYLYEAAPRHGNDVFGFDRHYDPEFPEESEDSEDAPSRGRRRSAEPPADEPDGADSDEGAAPERDGADRSATRVAHGIVEAGE